MATGTCGATVEEKAGDRPRPRRWSAREHLANSGSGIGPIG